MRFPDLLRLALANLRRNRTRSWMTLVGVMIGVAALMALLAYGAGLQHNVRSEFNALQLYNTLRVTTYPSLFNSFGDLAVRQKPDTTRTDERATPPLTDDLLQTLERMEGVLAAYPEILFPVEIEVGDREVVAQAEAIPMAFAQIPSYQPQTGHFFTSATDSSLLLAPSMARRLGFDDPAALVGQSIRLKTATLNLQALQRSGPAISMGLAPLPLHQVEHRMQVAGLLPEADRAVSSFVRVLVPLERAKTMQKVTFFSTLDLLLRDTHAGDGYPAVRVQLAGPETYADVRKAIEDMGLYVSSFRDQFAQLERLFLIMDLALGIIGVIALLVATIGMANTMMMNVMERTREIGVMKAVGGEEGDLQRLFLVESGILGLAGGLAGLALGWALTALIQVAIDTYLHRLGVPPIDVFHHPLVLWLSILALALVVSLLAGFAPARKAARVEPIAALRSV